MNEWVAFGIVAVICGLLAALTRWAGSGGDDRPDPPAVDSSCDAEAAAA